MTHQLAKACVAIRSSACELQAFQLNAVSDRRWIRNAGSLRERLGHYGLSHIHNYNGEKAVSVSC